MGVSGMGVGMGRTVAPAARRVGRAERGVRSEAWARVGPWAGIAFAVLLVLRGAFLDTPDSDASTAEWTEHFADSGNRTESIVGTYLMALTGVAFLWFLVSLCGRLREAEAPSGFLTRVTYGAGLVFVAMVFASGAAMGTVAASVEFGDSPVPDGEFARQLENLGFGLLLLFGMMAAGACMAAASLVALRAGVWPRWLAIAGLVAGPLVFLFGVLFLPVVLLLLWAVAVGIALIRSPSPAGAATAATAEAVRS